MKVHSSWYKTKWAYGLCGLLLLFYAWVLLLAFSPKVDAKYAAYFIEGTEDCWRTGETPFLSPGTQMPFGFGKPAHTCKNLSYGWDLRHVQWGSWSAQPASTLKIDLLSDAHRQAHLRFYLFGFSPLGNQAISVYLENDFHDEWFLAHEQIHTRDLWVDLQGPHTAVEFSFLFKESLSPLWLGKESSTLDKRLLGMALLGIDWVEP